VHTLLRFEIQTAGELVHGAGFGDVSQLVGAFDQLVTFGSVEFLRCPGDGVDMMSGDRPVVESVSKVRGLVQRLGSFGGLGCLPQRCLRCLRDGLLGERIDLT